ncbi:5588_t:CDS:2 [Entrophospora sp. SA101]|nr:5588_t:CDS:2 [Entrophospora sp. SA101]CAJ0901330.1 15713_t:CDS:2 [Entrophospora sp. SA101]
MACKTITKTSLFTSSNNKNNKTTTLSLTLTPSLNEREINVRLTKIFTKIGQLDIAQQGIQDLHDFLIEYPECDVKVNAFLASAGTFFHKYINKRLAEITTREMKARGMIQQDSTDNVAIANNSSNNIKSVTSTTTIPASSIISSIKKSTPLSISKKPKLHKINTSRFSSSSTSSNVSSRNGGDSDTSSPYSSSGEYTPPSSPETASSPTLLSSRMSREFKEKVTRETFEQTKSRLHKIFKYEEHKNGENVTTSLATKLEGFQSDVEKLQFVKNIILSKPRLAPSSIPVAKHVSWNYSALAAYLVPLPRQKRQRNQLLIHQSNNDAITLPAINTITPSTNIIIPTNNNITPLTNNNSQPTITSPSLTEDQLQHNDPDGCLSDNSSTNELAENLIDTTIDLINEKL